MSQSTIAAVVATSLALLAAFVIYTVSAPSGWLAGIGAVLVAFGVFGGTRGPTGVGVGAIAIASLTATSGEDMWFTLAVSAMMAVVAIVVLLVADMSFALRRDTVVLPATLQGLVAVHAVATVLGVGLAVLLIAGVAAVSWPGWLLLLPGIALGAAAVVMARQASSYNRKLRTVAVPPGVRYVPPPPPPGIRSTMPPPPAPGARPTGQVPPPPR